MSHLPFFHEASGAVRFWVLVNALPVGASVRREVLHFSYRGQGAAVEEDPLALFHAHRVDLEDAVRRRVAAGSIEPVLLREADLQPRA